MNSPDIAWISVDDRLPADDTLVLAFALEIHVLATLEDGVWWAELIDGSSRRLGAVTHWAHLTEGSA